MNKREQDRVDLDAALELIRKACPDAVAINVMSSDQDLRGFVLSWVEDKSGNKIEDALSDEDDMEVWDLLSCLDWRGVVGESKQGYARIPLAP